LIGIEGRDRGDSKKAEAEAIATLHCCSSEKFPFSQRVA